MVMRAKKNIDHVLKKTCLFSLKIDADVVLTLSTHDFRLESHRKEQHSN